MRSRKPACTPRLKSIQNIGHARSSRACRSASNRNTFAEVVDWQVQDGERRGRSTPWGGFLAGDARSVLLPHIRCLLARQRNGKTSSGRNSRNHGACTPLLAPGLTSSAIAQKPEAGHAATPGIYTRSRTALSRRPAPSAAGAPCKCIAAECRSDGDRTKARAHNPRRPAQPRSLNTRVRT